MSTVNAKQLKVSVTALKNYVDSKGTLSFKDNGNLLVTINGVTKEFAPVGSSTGGDTPTINYIVHYNLSHCTLDNTTESVQHGSSYSTTITVEENHTIQSITVIMGGIDITSTAYNTETKTISIATITGNISITISASAPVVGTINSNSKSISLNNLPAGTYTLKYESEEGIIEGFDTIATMEVQ